VLYLAEVIQKKGGIIGSGKSELKLLACQRGEQNWSAIAGEEAIAAEEANRFSPGTLLLVDLTNNKQVQRVQEAGRPLVNILQNFSRLQERFKTQEEEIEQWKQSLTYQSQELNRREMEMEARREQLQQMEAEFEEMEQQRQAFEATREEVLQQQEEVARQRQELEGAWEQLQGQKQHLEDRQTELLGACVLDEEKAQALSDMLDRLTNAGSIDALSSSIAEVRNLIQWQQDTLSYHWQILEQQQQTAQQMQQEVDQQGHLLAEQWQAWYQAQAGLEQARVDLSTKQSICQVKQDCTQKLGWQLQQQQALQQQLYRIREGLNSADGVTVNLEALEKMPLEELQSIVRDMQREFDQSSQFVRGQEEELDHKEREMESLKVKMSQVSEFDRLSLEAELNDEQDAYQFLNQTLVGQRRSLNDKEIVLRQHQKVLAKRQGKTDPADPSTIDLSGVFAQLETDQQAQTAELQTVEAQITEIQAAIAQLQSTVDTKSGEQDAKRNELKQLEETLKAQRVSAAELNGKVALYREMLQPWQDSVTGIQHQLEALSQSIEHGQASGQEQQQAIEQMRQMIQELTKKPEFAFA
jgi:chromosome segregation ATPase